ncbi:hypothetical protein GPECTOR_8g146 [Gonium pectorale]|uniref:Serine aminopeptidase S33 domain-containing protein n=1 Tax=Gonium pectorale TaxID=33097 RepID=A0A150GSC7_GONPE|nr:hypothetical protein GPECTOR_8g146 [Gonium pectorale]|eukprot:KXZ52755.1 hypothetical protein GPECTOR_8g146 [Gonium pectorale]
MAFLGRFASAAAIATALLAALAAVPYDKELSYGFVRDPSPTPGSAPIVAEDGLPYTRRTLFFTSQGTACEAWLYTPTAATAAATAAGGGRRWPPFPVVIMAHGLGGQKDLGLHRFADAFAAAGMAAFVFDYRTFGGSDGEPRHWVSPRRHLQDYAAALAFVKSGALGPQYDVNKVALWGTSYAGGHVLVTAAEAEPGSVAAVVSMVPHLDGVEASRNSVRRRSVLPSLRLLIAGMHDALRAAAARALRSAGLLYNDAPAADGFGANLNATAGGAAAATADGAAVNGGPASQRASGPLAALAPRLSHMLAPYVAPAYVKTIGTAGQLTVMQGGWQPRILARFTLETSSYSPIASVPSIAAPVLFVAAAEDVLCPVGLVRRAAGLVPGGNASVVELSCTHFDAYRGEHFQAAAAAMVRFLEQRLLR